MKRQTLPDETEDHPDLIERAVLAAGAVIRSAPQGAVAFKWQGLPRAFVLVKTGRLSVQFRTKDRQVPWAECRAGEGQDCMPVTASILSQRAISVRALCMAPSTWIELSPTSLVRLVHSQPKVRQVLFASHAKRIPTFFARISTKNSVGLDQRIADWLLRHARSNEVLATHADIAADLLTAREVVSRRLRAFATKGWIAQKRGCILIDAPAALSRVAKGVFCLGQAAQRPALG